MEGTFDSKYSEFCVDLIGACPELTVEISAAKDIPTESRLQRYTDEVYNLKKDSSAHILLPGVTIPETIWSQLSDNSIKAIKEYISILDLCVIYTTGNIDGVSQDWIDSIMRDWRTRMESVDFSKLSTRFFELFGKQGTSLPPLPEKFLKGKLAKLSEELIAEFNPEDFGFTSEDIAACEKDPVRAFEILIQVSTQKPEMIQKAMEKIGKRLQDKIQSGSLKPSELAAEAEELMKEFQSNPAFVEILESFRSAFSFEDPDFARSSGNDGSGRLALVRSRLKKKLEAKKARK